MNHSRWRCIDSAIEMLSLSYRMFHEMARKTIMDLELLQRCAPRGEINKIQFILARSLCVSRENFSKLFAAAAAAASIYSRHNPMRLSCAISQSGR
jgi:hypothetical protein